MNHTVGSEPWHQLIVIGNGFDLACNLRSKYKDFFETRRPKMELLKNEWASRFRRKPESCFSATSAVDDSGLTIWDVILFPWSDKDWCDIEQQIANAVVGTKIGGKRATRSAGSLASVVYVLLENYRKKWNDSKGVLSSDSATFCELRRGPADFDDDKVNVRIANYCLAAKGLDHFKSVDDVYSFFLDEVRSLETYFSAYLEGQVDKDTKYNYKATNVMRSLCKKEAPSQDIGDIADLTSVLSFNFTRPVITVPQLRGKLSWTNIHGELRSGSHVIFGIDGSGRMTDSRIIPFTKTYKLMALETPGQDTLIHDKKDGEPDSSTNLIKFYGHSLGEADYSYFQAIFDGVNLYASHTRLIFYYSLYDNVNGEEASAKMFRKVTRLLNTYATTMTNASHGENLMHKLLLEGRLTVQEYESEPELIKS